MKSFNFLILSIFLVAAYSCQKENEIETRTSEIKSNIIFNLAASTNNNLDGYVCLNFSDYFDSPNQNMSSTFLGGFKESEALIDAGYLSINDIYTIERKSDNRYLSNYNVKESDFCGRKSSVTFKSSSKDFASFKEHIYVPNLLKASSSIGKGEFFDKNSDLIINWETDATLDKVYLMICSPGVPCIIKEFDDTGKAVINNSEFSEFKKGENVFVHLGRGQEICYTLKRKQICLYSVIISRTSGHEIR